MKVKVAQLCLTLCDLMEYTAHAILQARILEWVDFPFARDLPNSGTELRSPALQADSLLAEQPSPRLFCSNLLDLWKESHDTTLLSQRKSSCFVNNSEIGCQRNIT